MFAATMADGTFLVFDKDLEERPLPLPLPQDRASLGFKVIKSEARTNPLACWLVSGQTLKGFEFSPDCRHVAIVGKDGNLRVFDFSEERLLVTFKSYFGGLSCVCWSPDGKYLLVRRANKTQKKKYLLCDFDFFFLTLIRPEEKMIW